MVEEATETNILRTFTYIERYVLERLLNKNKKGMAGILDKVINSNANYFQSSNAYAKHFPADQREYIAASLQTSGTNIYIQKAKKNVCILFQKSTHTLM